MPTTDRVIGVGTPDTADMAAAPLVAALQSLSRAYQKTTIYPEKHPSVAEALSLAAAGFEAALGDNEPIVAVVSRDHFLVEDEPLAETSDALASLAGMLFDLEIATLEFKFGVTVVELEYFIRVLSKAKREGFKGSAVVEALSQGGGRNILVRAVDYDVLQFSEGLRDRDEEPPKEDVWDNVSRMLADPEAHSETLSPKELAEEVSQEIREQAGTGVGLLRKRITRLSRKTKSLDSEKRREVEERLTAFVTSLSPKLRQDLLRLDPELPEESFELMTKVVDQLPDSDLLHTLQDLDHVGARIPDQLLILFNKLVRLSNKRPKLASGLQERLTRWGIPPATLTASPETLRSALDEVFRKRARSDFIPQTHRTLLEKLSKLRVDACEFNFDDRYRDPRDADCVRLHASEIAVRLLRGKSGEKQRAGIFAYLASAADSLIEKRQFGILRDTAVSARTYSMLNSESEENRRAAQGFLDEFKSDRRISLVIEHGCSETGFDEAAISLLTLGGQAALESVLVFLADEPPPEAAADLSRFVKSRSHKAQLLAVEARMSLGFEELKPFLRILREMPAAEVAPLLEKLFTHDDPRVRLQAMQILCEVDERPGSPVRHLLRALRDENPRVTALALRKLVDLDTEDSSDLLGDYLEGETCGLPPAADHARLAASSLLERGDYGLSRLCVVLNKLRRSFNLRKTLTAAIIAEVLREKADISLVRRCLRRWKFSPSRIVASMLSRFRGSKRESVQ
jgi:hypothetical protein